MQSMHIGQSYPFSVAGSDGSALPAGALSVNNNRQDVAAVTVNADATGTVTALATGQASLTFIAAGYKSTQEVVEVAPLPSLVVTNGPIA